MSILLHYSNSRGNGVMNRRSSLLNELREDHQKQNSHQSLHQLTAGLGIASSIAFLMMFLYERPKAGLVIAAIAAIFLMVRWARRTKVEAKGKTPAIQFDSLRKHRVTPSAAWMKTIHLGHAAAIDQLARGLDRDLSLASSTRILGAHLLLGPSGTGKTQLATLIGQALFGKKNIIEFDFQSLDEDSFSEQFFEMLQKIEKNPHQLILLDHAETMPAAMMDPFLEIFKTNEWRQRSEVKGTSFSGCMFIILANLKNVPDDLKNDQKKRSWLEQSGALHEQLVSFCNEIAIWGTLPHEVMAEITCKQIIEHWAQQSIELNYVTPEVIFVILKETKPKAHLGAHSIPALIRLKSSSALERSKRMMISKAVLDIDENGFFIVDENTQPNIQRPTIQRRAS